MPLVTVLRQQHQAGRRLTDQIRERCTLAAMQDGSQRRTLAEAIHQFIRMYRPHAAREDTVLFPAFVELAGKQYRKLGDAFEKKERAVLGDKGFERSVVEVARLEQALGINDLAAFTPVAPP